MLAYHIESHCLGHIYVIAEGIVSGGGVQAVRPPALVKRAVLEQRLVVKAKDVESLGGLHNGTLPERGVSVNSVKSLPFIVHKGYAQAVEEWIVRRPEPGRAYGKPQLGSGIGGGFRQDLGILRHYGGIVADGSLQQFHLDGGGAGCGFNVHCEHSGIDVRGGHITVYVCCRSAFQPHALPDTCHRRVPDASGLRHLLAARNLCALVSGVQNLYHQLLGIAFEVWGYIYGERSVSTGMIGYEGAVKIDFGSPVYSLEMK